MTSIVAEPKPRPRVTLVAHGIHDQGGMERAFAELIRRAHEDYRFTVIAADLAPELEPLVRWERIRVPRRPIPLKSVVFYIAAGLRLRLLTQDIVHLMGAIVPNRVDVATVQHCHAGFRATTGRLAPRHAPLLRRVNTSLDRLLALACERWSYRPTRTRYAAAVSEGVAAELERFYPGVTVVLTPNGTDLDRFAPNAAERSRLRDELGVGEADFVALFVGGNWDLKGLGIAIEAVGRVITSGGAGSLWVVGDGDRPRFERLSEDAGAEHHVRFFGSRPDSERFMQGADALVLPSDYEAASLVAREAAACGIPVVATSVNGMSEVIGADEAGLIVDRDPDAVAAALLRIAADRPLRRRMGRAARERALSFGWDRSVQSVVGLYERVLADRTAVGDAAFYDAAIDRTRSMKLSSE